MYLPISQNVFNYSSLDLVVRTAAAPVSALPDVRAALRRVDPTLPVADFHTMSDLMDRSLFPRRFVLSLVMGFAFFGLLLLSLGICAVIGFAVRQRAPEIAIRMALGATATRVRLAVLGSTGVLVTLGLAIGLPLSWATTRSIGALLYGIDAADPATYIAVMGILGLVAGLAGYLPATRATAVDPADTLRSEMT
jgi:ABC-type antimicrobial peptide transport system permease subunit